MLLKDWEEKKFLNINFKMLSRSKTYSKAWENEKQTKQGRKKGKKKLYAGVENSTMLVSGDHLQRELFINAAETDLKPIMTLLDRTTNFKWSHK